MGHFHSAPLGTPNNPYKVLMIGLDNAGKTTALYRTKLNEPITTIPTIGFNVEDITTRNGFPLMIWDVSSNHRTRSLLRHYCGHTHGVILIVDCTDRERFEEARECLNAVIEEYETRGVPLVVFANKQDLPNAADEFELIEGLQLHKLVKRKWHVQRTCATTGEGLHGGLERIGALCKDYVEEIKPRLYARNEGSQSQILFGPLIKKLRSVFEPSSANRVRILILGLRNAGKTIILYRLKQGQTVQTTPTEGFNLESIKYDEDVTFEMWDVSLRLPIKHFLKDTQGLILVIDSSDKDQFKDSYEYLKYVLSMEEAESIPLIVFSNKQDLSNAVSSSEIFDALHLHEFSNRKLHIQAACGKTGEGLTEGMKKLSILTKEFTSRKTGKR